MAKLDELHNYAYPDKYLDELHIYDKKIGNNSSDEIHYYGNRGITYGLDEVHLYGSYQTVVEEDEINKPSDKKYEVIDIDEYFDEIEDLDEGQKEIRKELANEYKDILELILMMILAELKVGNTVDDIYYKTLAKSRMMNVVDDLLPNITIDIYSQIENYIGNNIELVIDSTLRHTDDGYYFSEARATSIACDDSMATVNLEELSEAIQAGYKYKIWNTMRDNRVRHTHEVADEQKVPIDKPFTVGRCKMQAPMVFDENSEFKDDREVIRCRCFMVYSNKGDDKTSDDKDEREFLRNNLPKGYKDERKVGELISQDEFNNILTKANAHGIRLGSNNDGGNFQLYRGNKDVLDSIIDKVIKEKESHGIKDLILEYDNVLGYNGDKSKIDIGAFAETYGKTIRLNKYMYDDSNFLKSQYETAVKSRLFAKGTDYNNVIDHELGHIIAKNNPEVINKTLRELKTRAERANLSLGEYMQDNISAYANVTNEKGVYSELIPELNSMANGSDPEFALDLLKIGGVLG